MKIAILCGGPSLERGISLNSARSVLDHLANENVEIIPFYFDFHKKIYKISTNQLYSNNPSDFDFKLQQTSSPLTKSQFISNLKKVDIVFPIMHGFFGEDGSIQSFLEKNKIPFIGTGSNSCKKLFDKYKAGNFIKKLGFYTLPTALLKIYQQNNKQIINDFFIKNNIKRAIVKPCCGGSSIGVFSVTSIDEALEKADLIFSKRMDTRVILEPFVKGIEFTVIILQNKFNLPVAILPTEIETDYSKNQIFDFRRKYLPTRQVIYHCPPRFDNHIIEKIQVQAEQIFTAFGMNDFGRFDGWILENGKICFSDFNPISGMEQNSFLFQQSARVGLSHSDVLKYIVQHACNRYKINFPINQIYKKQSGRKIVNVLFGGKTSERQVSLMSGTNAWLKLRSSDKYEPRPFLLDFDNNVWKLPYQLTLNHTVEEIIQNCKNFPFAKKRLAELEKKVRLKLAVDLELGKSEFSEPIKMSLDNFIQETKNEFVFIGLHGGFGENGDLQKILTKNRIKFNGPDEKVSRLCMDKWKTKEFIDKIQIDNVLTIPGVTYKITDFEKFKNNDFKTLWRKLCGSFSCKSLIIKPRAEGCSSGVVRLFSYTDLINYIHLVKQNVPFIPKHTFTHQINIIEMPLEEIKNIIIEKYIETDSIKIKANKLKYSRKNGYLEITIGLIAEKNKIKAFNPSITIAECQLLTVEEKFQGGTGVNITPPPKNIMGNKAGAKIKKNIEKLAETMGIRGYSRIDAFAQVNTGDLIIIEINTLPGLTPSTVFFQQALAEDPSIPPKHLLEKLIENKEY